MDVINNKGEVIGYRTIRADRKGGVYYHITKTDFSTRFEDVELLEQGVCPDCGMLLVGGISNGGEPFEACESCDFYTE